MMTSRERVRQALDLQPTDRTPKDFAGMRSTGISAFAYPKLVAALGLPPRRPRVEDTGQMLGMPDLDVLDALDIDVVTIRDGVTNAFAQPGVWHDYDFGGRLAAQVRDPLAFEALPDGTLLQGNRRMVPDSFVFDDPHGGQPLDLSETLPKPDLARLKEQLKGRELRDTQIVAIRDLCRRVRESTDRAVFLNEGSLSLPMGIAAYGGLAIFPMLCLLEPDFVTELHEIVTEHTLKNVRALLPEIRHDVDILMLAADDWGTQANLIASPKVYRTLFLPFHQRATGAIAEVAPEVKRFLHCCGAVYDLIDLVIEAGFDILNPVQWSAGKHTYQEWKDKARGRIALWGGGVNSQITLPLGTVADVEREVREVTAYLSQDGGYVFCNIHNILAEIQPDKVIAMYRAVP
jgi:uroporphyrinogen decarboxylase